jgi:hypothetical protein
MSVNESWSKQLRREETLKKAKSSIVIADIFLDLSLRLCIF